MFFVDPDAYEAYLKGQFYWEKLDKESMEKALEYFELAIEIDPEWADPNAGLANAWGLFGTFLRALPKSITLPRVFKYLDKSLELNPNSAKAHLGD
jgi:tetratricopeptide (TPR) repeat protein